MFEKERSRWSPIVFTFRYSCSHMISFYTETGLVLCEQESMEEVMLCDF